MNPTRVARQLLRDWHQAGVSHIPRVTRAAPAAELPAKSVHVEPLKEAARSSGPSSSSMSFREAFAGQQKPGPARTAPPVVREQPTTVKYSVVAPNVVLSTASQEERDSRLAVLAQCVADCRRCAHLAATRTQTVFGVGNSQARVMFIGEAPGADEDQTGIPFVGKAGQLLTKIIEACGWRRDDLYICNVLRCRPPENRTPTETEANNCREYLDGQIAIVDPDYIVCWGSCAAQNLLASKESIGKMRQRFYQYGRAKVLCTYHPSYLLRNPAAKKPVWDDMKFLLAEMGITPPKP